MAVRWKLRCFPRLLDRSLVNLDGISEYKFNDRGLIYQHTVRLIVESCCLTGSVHGVLVIIAGLINLRDLEHGAAQMTESKKQCHSTGLAAEC